MIDLLILLILISAPIILVSIAAYLVYQMVRGMFIKSSGITPVYIDDED